MKILNQHLLGRSDLVIAEGLHHRQLQQNLLASNIANAQVPGYRAQGYRFEDQLQAYLKASDSDQVLKSSHKQHHKQPGVSNGHIKGDLFTRASESVSMDGNTVNVDQEMAEMAETQILYKASIEIFNKRMNILRYAMNGGRS